MKNTALNILIVIALGFLAYQATLYFESRKPLVIVQPEAPSEKPADLEKVPDFSFTAFDQTLHNIKDFEGKVVLINFWASWCAPCVKEFPHLIDTAKNHPEDVVLIGLSSDIDTPTMEQFFTKMDFDPAQHRNIYMVLDEDSLTQNVFQTFALPETLIIDQDGNMREKLIGADWEQAYLEKQIGILLDETSEQ